MTETLISLIIIFIGIVGAIGVGSIFKKYSFGIVGNTIAGVFGSVFLIKSFGRLGFNPQSIMQGEAFNVLLFGINCFVSFLGGALGLVVIKKLYYKMNKKPIK